ncbi:hypothetical protein LUZ60_015024 [Juncus effusus]|nr:hypothetical protein LUZ60_015024 [Juncus effusus]
MRVRNKALEFSKTVAMKCIRSLFLFSIFLLPLAQTTSLTFQTKTLLHWKSTLENQNSLHSWNIDASPCNWTGITCCTTNRERQIITKISLPDMGLVGTLDALNFSAFPSVRILNLSSNHLSGAIPSTAGLLSKLTHLDLSVNQFPDFMPLQICSLSKLSYMDVSQNQLTGPIPTSVGNLTKLEAFYLYHNKISGSIPE